MPFRKRKESFEISRPKKNHDTWYKLILNRRWIFQSVFNKVLARMWDNVDTKAAGDRG